MKKRIITIATTLVMATSAMAQDVVRLGTEGAYPPWNFINDAGKVDGFERDLGDEVCKRASLNCEWVTNEWDSIIPNLVSGNYDAIIAGMSITDERDEVIDFTSAYTPPDPTIYVAAGDYSGGGVVAAQTSTIQAAYLAELDGVTLVEFATPDETVAAVKNGEADAVFADSSFLMSVTEGDPDLKVVYEPVALGGGVGMGVRESDAELRGKFDAAIQSMKDDGSLNEMIKKWEVSSLW